MRTSLPGSDAWLSPPEPKRRRHSRSTLTIYVERDDIEHEVEVEFDEGCVYGATLNGAPFELTPDERERAEVDYSEEEIARYEAAREDDADRRRDR